MATSIATLSNDELHRAIVKYMEGKYGVKVKSTTIHVKDGTPYATANYELREAPKENPYGIRIEGRGVK